MQGMFRHKALNTFGHPECRFTITQNDNNEKMPHTADAAGHHNHDNGPDIYRLD